jgi:hypothetical protein
VAEISADYDERFGFALRSIPTTILVNGWGSCGPGGNVIVN